MGREVGGRVCFMYKKKTARVETPTLTLYDFSTPYMKQIYEVEEKPFTSSFNVYAPGSHILYLSDSKE
jgi:hypothetical protein